MILKKYRSFLSATLLLAGLSATGCSSSTSPSDQATINMRSEMTTSSVSSMSESGSVTPQGLLVVDSIQVTRIRIFLKDLKMHRSEDDTLKESLGGEVKTGAFVAVFDQSGSHLISTNVIPTGTYDRVKFEIHKPDPQKDGLDFTDPNYADFVAGDKYTVLIDGKVWQGGVSTAFTARSRVSDNIQLKFSSPIALNPGSTSDIALQLDPTLIFKDKANLILDPRDVSNQDKIDAGVKAALKINKK